MATKKKEAATPEVKAEKASVKKTKKVVAEEAKEVIVDEKAVAEKTISEKPAPKQKKVKTQGPSIVTIDDERSVLTDADILKKNLLDAIESKKSGKILTDTINGVETYGDKVVATLNHGLIKVIIPAEFIVDADIKEGENQKMILGPRVTRRLGAEIDYIVEAIDEANGVIVGNRVSAMKQKIKKYYYGFTRDGDKLLYPGVICEGRIVSVTKTGVFVEVFGKEGFVKFNELSYKRLVSADDEFQTGQRVLVKIIDLDTSDKDDVKVSFSIKQAQSNPFEQAVKKYSVNNLYTGKVTMIDQNGVFVALDGGVDCLCKFPERGRPAKNTRATVRILGIDTEHGKIWGVITHMSNTR